MINRKLKRFSHGLGVVALAVATACGGSGGGGGASPGTVDASHPYNVLAIVADSGAFKPVTDLQLNALQVTADRINASGGILGRKVVISSQDDGGDPAKAVSLLQTALAGANKPDAVYAGTTSNESLAMVPILSSQKIFNIGTTASAKLDDPTNYPYTFRPTGPNSKFADFLANYMKGKGYTKVGLIASNDAIGQSFVDAYKASFGKVGVTLQTELYNATDVDMTPQLQRLASGSPQAIVVNANSQSISPIIFKSRAKLGLTIPFYGDVGVTADLYNIAGADAVKGCYVAGYKADLVPASGTNTPSISDFVTAVKARGPISSQLIAATLAWDALKMIQVAAKQANSVDPDKLKSALENLKEQPAGTFLTYAQMKFSGTEHFNQGGTDADFGASTIGPVVDGQYKPAP